MQFLWLWDGLTIIKSPWANSLIHLWWNFSFSAMFPLLNLKVNSSFISSTLHWVSWSGTDNKILASAAVHGVAKSQTWLSNWTELNWVLPPERTLNLPSFQETILMGIDLPAKTTVNLKKKKKKKSSWSKAEPEN